MKYDIKDVSRRIRRTEAKVNDLKERKANLSIHGYWDLGFYEGRLSVLEEILDDLIYPENEGTDVTPAGLLSKSRANAEESPDLIIFRVVKAVDRALRQYSADHVDVVRNEETDMLDVIFHSDNNSFPVEAGVALFDSCNVSCLESILDNRKVGHVW